jgi:RHH-type transcriptional regulator, rel operon repressor / antitoxin RelB
VKTTTVRIEDEMLFRIDTMAESLNRSRSWVINQAVESFLNHEEWLVQEIKDGLAEVKHCDVAPEEAVVVQFKKWGVNAG